MHSSICSRRRQQQRELAELAIQIATDSGPLTTMFMGGSHPAGHGPIQFTDDGFDIRVRGPFDPPSGVRSRQQPFPSRPTGDISLPIPHPRLPILIGAAA